MADPLAGAEQGVQVRGQEMLSAIAEAGTAGRRAFDAARNQLNMDRFTRAATMEMQPGAGNAPAGAMEAAMAPMQAQDAVASQALGAQERGFTQGQQILQQGAENFNRQQLEAVPLARERTGRQIRVMHEKAEAEKAAREEERSFRREQMAMQKEMQQLEMQLAKQKAAGGGIDPLDAARNARAEEEHGWNREDRRKGEERRAAGIRVRDDAFNRAKTDEFKSQLAEIFSFDQKTDAFKYIESIGGSKQRKDALRLWATRFYDV